MDRTERPRRIAAAAARQNLSRLLTDVRREEEPVIIEKGGVPVAAVVPLSVLERDRRWRKERTDRIALLERLRRPFKDLTLTDVEREAASAVRAARSHLSSKRRTRR
jgi:prevent-host-death family protein